MTRPRIGLYWTEGATQNDMKRKRSAKYLRLKTALGVDPVRLAKEWTGWGRTIPQMARAWSAAEPVTARTLQRWINAAKRKVAQQGEPKP